MLNDYEIGRANALTRYRKLTPPPARGAYYKCGKDKVEKTPHKPSCSTMTRLGARNARKQRKVEQHDSSEPHYHVLYDEDDDMPGKHKATSKPHSACGSHCMVSQCDHDVLPG
jgi:hypothetical protein